MTRTLAALRAIRGGRWAEIWDVGEAQISLLWAQAMRRMRPIGEFVHVTSPHHTTLSLASLSPEEARTCRRIALAIDRAARYGIFSPFCLTRAVALSRLLDAQGIAGHRISIGVRREGGSFMAHAWVERGREILGDSATDPLMFSPLTQVSVSGRIPALPTAESIAGERASPPSALQRH